MLCVILRSYTYQKVCAVKMRISPTIHAELMSLIIQVREGLDFAGLQFVESMLIYSKSAKDFPWYLSTTAFWIFSVILLSWPLRLICDFRTAHVSYQITKLFGTNYLRLLIVSQVSNDLWNLYMNLYITFLSYSKLLCYLADFWCIFNKTLALISFSCVTVHQAWITQARLQEHQQWIAESWIWWFNEIVILWYRVTAKHFSWNLVLLIIRWWFA